MLWGSKTQRELNSMLDHEKAHGEYLAEHGAEDVWGWATPAGRRRAARRASFFSEHLDSSTTALEIGCGTGYFTRLTASSGAKITAIDLSETLLKEAREKTSESNITYEIADAHALKYDDAAFDVVFGSSILHHLNLENALAEILRVLRPGGWMVFAEPNMVNPQIWAERNIDFVRVKTGTSPDETAFVRWDVASKMRAAGFVNIEVRPHEFLHPATPEFAINWVQKFTSILEKLPGLREIGGSLLIKGQKQ